MTQQNENLSAFVDGELQDDSILKSLKQDAELGAKWQSYHLIRDTLRKELPEQLNFDISANVAAALQNEPALLAPKRTWRDTVNELPLIGRVVPLARQGGQFAIAASVAVAMILGVQQLNQPEIDQPFRAKPTLSGIQGGLSPVSLEQTRAVPRPNVVEQRRRINAYLTDHHQQMRLKLAQPSTSAVSEDTSVDTSKEQDNIEQTPK